MGAEPRPFDPSWPRYSARPFPSYRYVPGHNPHPTRDERGHSYGAPQLVAAPWRPEQWASLDLWLFGVDLFNYAYWWESHEQLEALWHAAGRTTEPARFVQGLIKIAAGALNLWIGKADVAREQASAGCTAMLAAPRSAAGCYMGIDVEDLAARTSAWFERRSRRPPLIALRFGDAR